MLSLSVIFVVAVALVVVAVDDVWPVCLTMVTAVLVSAHYQH